MSSSIPAPLSPTAASPAVLRDFPSAMFRLKQRSAARSASSRRAMRSRSMSSTAASPFASPMRKWQRESPSSVGNSPQATTSVISASLSRTSVRWHRAESGIAKRLRGCEKSADRKRETCRIAALSSKWLFTNGAVGFRQRHEQPRPILSGKETEQWSIP